MQPPAALAEALHETFRDRSDEAWLDILIASLRVPEIDGVPMPMFPDETVQREIHGHAGEVSLHEAHTFFKEVKAYASYCGRAIGSHRRLLDFGCGWGRVLRLFMKDIHASNLFGTDSTSRFLMDARRCNPALSFLPCGKVPPTIMAPGTLDYVISWSVFSHFDEYCATRWVEEFHRLLMPGGLVLMTTQSRRFIQFCAEMRMRRASGIRLEHPWYEACADSFTDEALANSRYEAGMFLHASTSRPPHEGAHYGEAIIPKGFIGKAWGHLFELVDFVDSPVRLPQALIVLQKRA